MSSVATLGRLQVSSGWQGWIGRCHVHPAVDYLLIGGGLTIPIFTILHFFPAFKPADGQFRFFLFVNAAHFAASTVRLYTKPGAKEEFPILSWWFPVVCLLAVAFGLYSAEIGKHLTALYFTWSPYHYAAQTYGLAVMYAMRSGARLEARDKAHIRWVCMLPFLYAFFTGKESGLGWFVGQESLIGVPGLAIAHRGILALLTLAILTLPLSLFWQLRHMRGKNVPLITVVLQLTNGIWWLATDYPTAWWWAAMFHSVQYLIIVMVTHANEQSALRAKRRNALDRPIVHAGLFYGASLLLSAFLFFVVPLGFVALGFAANESFWMMVAVINLHHFIVDAFIWRSRPAKHSVPVSAPTNQAAA